VVSLKENVDEWWCLSLCRACCSDTVHSPFRKKFHPLSHIVMQFWTKKYIMLGVYTLSSFYKHFKTFYKNNALQFVRRQLNIFSPSTNEYVFVIISCISIIFPHCSRFSYHHASVSEISIIFQWLILLHLGILGYCVVNFYFN